MRNDLHAPCPLILETYTLIDKDCFPFDDRPQHIEIPVHQHQIRQFPFLDGTGLGIDADQAGGIQAAAWPGLFQCFSAVFGKILQSAVHRQRTAGQRTVRDAQLCAVMADVDLLSRRLLDVMAVRQSGRTDHIRDQDHFLPAFRLPGDLLRGRMGMDIVADELAGIAVQRQRAADGPGLPVAERPHAVEKMRHTAESVVQRLPQYIVTRGSMSGGDADPFREENVSRGHIFRKFGGDGDAFDYPRVQEGMAFIRRRQADEGRVLGPAFGGVEERPFQMDAGDLREIAPFADEAAHTADGFQRLLPGAGHGRGQVGGHTVFCMERSDLKKAFRIRVHRAVTEAAMGVDVDHPRQQVLPVGFDDLIRIHGEILRNAAFAEVGDPIVPDQQPADK